MRLALALALVGACAPARGLEFDPAQLDFGEVDFTGEMPDTGYALLSVSVTNPGTRTETIALPAYDDDHLCLVGFGTQDFPVDLGDLAPGATYVLQVGVCAYVSGEVGSLVETGLEVDSDGPSGTINLPIAFTPVRTDE
ncbi:MAG: hypothetical protein Q8P41_31105 [Pseudomonadota bacterium]|nr:hypothetical protein [Pseudomonadota bacterium]